MNFAYKSLKNTLKNILPVPMFNILRFIRRKLTYMLFNFKYCKIQINYKNIIKKLKKKEKIKVAFFVDQCAVWKCDGIYRKFLEDKKFDPIVVLVPYMVAGKEIMVRDMNQAYNYFKTKNYNVIKTYNKQTDSWLDVKKTINPDIVFFTKPYQGLTKYEYYIYNWLDSLTCYIPYFYSSGSHNEVFHNLPLQNMVWRYFSEYESKKEEIAEVAYSKARNVVYLGYPNFDHFISYKKHDNKRKKIIWSPHHSIIGQIGCDQSNFLELADFMLNIVKKYKEIDFVFKPHPLLINKLYIHESWGKSKTDEYYKEWESHPNTKIELGDYITLFQESDALIHDCGSFINEYLAVDKPCMYCVKSQISWNNLSGKTKDMFEKCYYLAYKKEDIVDFIEKVVIKGQDKKKDSRTKYVKENIIPLNGKSASDNIFNYIKKIVS